LNRFRTVNLRKHEERRQMSELALADTEGEELATSRTVRLRVPARPEFIALARLALSGFAELARLSEEDVADLKLALTESVSSSVTHANPSGAGFVSVAYELSATALQIEVAGDSAGSRRRFMKQLQPTG
jgi:anti-sigma regulatory factor (Ser/Thr protein kinase)